MIHKVFAVFHPGMLKDHNLILPHWYPICESKEIYKYNVFKPNNILNKYSAYQVSSWNSDNKNATPKYTRKNDLSRPQSTPKM